MGRKKIEELRKEDKKYPTRLKEIENAPEKIFIEGNSEILETKSIAVIGSRNCSSYGEKWCRYFVKKLIEYGVTIVSGMAIRNRQHSS